MKRNKPLNKCVLLCLGHVGGTNPGTTYSYCINDKFVEKTVHVFVLVHHLMVVWMAWIPSCCRKGDLCFLQFSLHENRKMTAISFLCLKHALNIIFYSLFSHLKVLCLCVWFSLTKQRSSSRALGKSRGKHPYDLSISTVEQEFTHCHFERLVINLVVNYLRIIVFQMRR